MSLTEDESVSLRQALMTRVPRSVVLVPNNRAKKDEIAADAANNLGLTVFDATAIEESKAVFISSQEAVAVFANRYDGIDFPGDECGLLFLDGLPKTTNAQERFFVSRMGGWSASPGAYPNTRGTSRRTVYPIAPGLFGCRCDWRGVDGLS